MPSTHTARNRAEKQGAGENNNSWGTRLNEKTIDIFDEALDGMASYALSGSKTLSSNNAASDEARCRYQNITGGTGGTVTIPNVEKVYIVRNNCTGAVVFTTGSGTTASVAAKTSAIVICEAGNVVRSFTVNDTFDINFVIDGGGAAIQPGIAGDLMIDFNCEVLEWTMLGDQAGIIGVDIWKDTYANFPPLAGDSIAGSEHPNIYLNNKGQASTLTGWAPSIAAGSILRFNVEACVAITRATLVLKCVRSG